MAPTWIRLSKPDRDHRHGDLLSVILMVLLTACFLAACGGAPSKTESEEIASSASEMKDYDQVSGPDRRPSGAKPLPINTSSSDHCSSPDGDKTDWWYTDIPGQGTLTLTLKINSVGNDLNLVMYDSSGTVIASSRGGESVVKEVVEKDVLEGRYYARIYAARDTDRSAYELENAFKQKSGIDSPRQTAAGSSDGMAPLVGTQNLEGRKQQSPLEESKRETVTFENQPRIRVPIQSAPESTDETGGIPEMSKLAYDQGMEVQQITPRLAMTLNTAETTGLVVVDVEGGSPAAAAGFRRGDLILAVDEQPVKKLNDLNRRIQEYRNGDIILFLIKRGLDTLYMILRVEEPR